MIKLLGASALALTLSMPAAHAAHRYRHVSRMSAHLADRHRGYGVRHLAWDRTGWRHRAAARRNGMRDAPFGDAYANAGRRDDARYESRPSEIHSTELHAGGVGPRPRAWCGWYARQLVGQDPGPSFNLARNWAHWGHATGPGVGVMVVWPHHVGMITGQAPNGEWIVKSGNDGHGAVHERPRSVAGAIAFRAS
jgi:hypothetical protein